MKLPSLAVRATLKLQNPAQRLYWALSNYESCLLPSPAVVAVPANGIPATAAIPAPEATFAKDFTDRSFLNFSLSEQPKYYNFEVGLLLNNAMLARGLEVVKCFRETRLNVTQTYLGTVPGALPAANDTSTATTLEEYIYEQWLLLQADRAANPLDTGVIGGNSASSLQLTFIKDTRWWGTSDYAQNYASKIVIYGSLFKDKAIADLNTYQLKRTPWDVTSYAEIATQYGYGGGGGGGNT